MAVVELTRSVSPRELGLAASQSRCHRRDAQIPGALSASAQGLHARCTRCGRAPRIEAASSSTDALRFSGSRWAAPATPSALSVSASPCLAASLRAFAVAASAEGAWLVVPWLAPITSFPWGAWRARGAGPSRHERGEAHVTSALLLVCDWSSAPFAQHDGAARAAWNHAPRRTLNESIFRIAGCGPNVGCDSIFMSGNLRKSEPTAICPSRRARFAPMQ